MSKSSGLTVVALQPGYLPWLGFFDQIRRSDVFIFYDEAQFDKQGWRNRNRIKAPTGLPHWLTVPVHRRGKRPIMDVEIDDSFPWRHKHIESIRQFYTNAPYLNRYLPELEELLFRPWELIADLDIALVRLMCSWLGLNSRLVRSSELGVEGRRSELALNFCRHFGASRFLSGDAAQSYLDVGLLTSNGVEVEWQNYRHPIYPQQHGDFVPYLSALDLILNCGEESAAILERHN